MNMKKKLIAFNEKLENLNKKKTGQGRSFVKTSAAAAALSALSAVIVTPASAASSLMVSCCFHHYKSASSSFLSYCFRSFH